MESELAPDLLDMALGRALRDEKASGDLPVRQPLTDEDRHLFFAAGETRRRHRDRAEHSSGHRRAQKPVPKSGTDPGTSTNDGGSFPPQPPGHSRAPGAGA